MFNFSSIFLVILLTLYLLNVSISTSFSALKDLLIIFSGVIFVSLITNIDVIITRIRNTTIIYIKSK